MTDRKRKLDIGDSISSSSSRQGTADDAINKWTGRPYSGRYFSILATRQMLPVYQFKDDLIDAVRKNQFVVVEGETGSGTSCCCDFVIFFKI